MASHIAPQTTCCLLAKLNIYAVTTGIKHWRGNKQDPPGCQGRIPGKKCDGNISSQKNLKQKKKKKFSISDMEQGFEPSGLFCIKAAVLIRRCVRSPRITFNE